MAPSGLIAVIAGWVTTEVGRQPYTVYGLLRTAGSLSPVAAPAVAWSLGTIVVVYFGVFGAGIYYLLRIIPVIIGYTSWAYWVFRGKVASHGYH